MLGDGPAERRWCDSRRDLTILARQDHALYLHANPYLTPSWVYYHV